MHWEEPAAVQKRSTDFFISLLSDADAIEYVRQCTELGIPVYQALEGFQAGVPVEYLALATEGTADA